MKLLVFLTFTALSGLAAAPSNSVVVRNLTSTATSRPITVSRVFAKGDIKDFAQARVGGSSVLTQCDVKTRYPDGSLKHALVSFQANLPAGGSVVVDFINQTTGNNTGHLASTAEMLAPSWMTGSPAWNAEMEIAGGGATIVKNARTMLSRLSLAPNQIRYWMQGPIATQVIVEDRTPALSEDIGLDANKSLHPIYVLTFYQGWKGVKVEYIMENAWATKLQDQAYALTLRAGASLSTAYSKPTFTHFPRTRWRKVFWSGADLDRDGSGARTINIDFNQAYLSYSLAIPNYDPNASPDASTISNAVSNFNKTDRGDINGNGQFAKLFGTTGGREEIGLYPTWEARYLTTFNPQMYDVVLGNGAVAGHVPMHLRESDVSLGTSYFGKVLSLDARPSGPGPTSVGPISDSGWRFDVAHQAAFAFIPYLITGDWYFMEEMQFWASIDAISSDPGTCSYCRNAGMGIIAQPNQARGLAWGLRNLAHAAYFTPDSDVADKAYYTRLVANNLGAYEGKQDIQDGAYYNTPQWKFGHDVIAPNSGGGKIGLLPNPLGFVLYNSNCTVGAHGMDSTVISYCDSPWMHNYLRAALGRVVELGFPADKLLAVSSRELINGILNPQIGNPYLQGSYNAPRTAAGTKLWFQTWAAYASGFAAAERAKRSWAEISPSSDDRNPDNGYPHLARAAASFITQISDGPYSGQAAYDWLDSNVNKSGLQSNPKWALIPRTSGGIVAPSSPCDVSGDGRTDVTDVQLSLNGAIGSGPASIDLDQNGRTDVVDVQRVTNAALGGPCRVGL